MGTHPLAGKPAPDDLLIDVEALEKAYLEDAPDPSVPEHRVSFGTSGHRGTATARTFNDAHVAAICQAVAEQRAAGGATGPLYLGRDTHALSDAAHRTAIEVFAANRVPLRIQTGDGPTPTPVISHAILMHNHAHPDARADGIIITPSHNPPADGGIKYNPTTGGPAGTDVTAAIEARANELLEAGLTGVKRTVLEVALALDTIEAHDFVMDYVEDLGAVVDMDCIREASLSIGVDPLGGAGLPYWEPIAEEYGLDISVVNEAVDPTFGFMHVDHDGKIRMDCSSPHAMAGLVAWRTRFDIAFGNDPDADRHGIVAPSSGLLSPNHYLSALVSYLFRHRPEWPAGAQIGKTLVSSSMIDRVADDLGRAVCEVPVGFKWFVDGLLSGTMAFCGEESSGASCLRRDGTVWSTDKDGILLNLLAAEMTARLGRDPGRVYADLAERFGSPVFDRIDAPASAAEKAALRKLSRSDISASELAGDRIRHVLTHAPGNDAAIGGVKVVTDEGWFAARPSGTEDIYKIYAESFRGEDHLRSIQDEARAIVTRALGGG